MITCDNIREIIKHISKKDLKRIKNTKKEYVILEVIASSNTCYINVTLTNNTPKTLMNGEYILYINDKIFDNIRY